MSSQLSVYNTLSRTKEIFEPINPPFVGLYVCGPTVYNEVHTGNLRTFTSFDIIYRYLVFLGYKVRYVRNITDAGHLTNDAGEGVNRMESQARLEKLEPMEVVQKYTVGFHEVCRKFNLIRPTIEPTATGHIVEQIEMIKQLIDNGVAYESNGSVYFDVKKYNEINVYGVLSGRNIDELIAGYRDLDGQDEKRNSIDFALWKKADISHIMQWPSPWGNGFPGWHLECSVMSTKYLGETFDIHGGGMDLKFPHHECEIAQNVGAIGVAPVKYWLHSNMLNFNGQKMSKSLGNSVLPTELITGNHPLLEKAYSPMTVRFLFLMSHYSSESDISNKALQDAEKGYKKLMQSLKSLKEMPFVDGELDSALDNEINKELELAKDNMNDDFNTPRALANLFALSSHINTFFHNGKKVVRIQRATYDELVRIFNGFLLDVFGLAMEEESNSMAMDGVMQLVIEMRNDARNKKDWPMSDKIRDYLKNAGIVLKDNKDGDTSYEVI
ncbi:MAG: cysteine--tRNA ligase [Bacteroidetes bacterium]|nr:cysteine--tRNA ligase [Bacteroidota bacterium]MBL0286246.1 cysteine--tRNA ligase [Bacteroidota bacterium]